MNYARYCRLRQAATLFGLSERHYDRGVPEHDQTQSQVKSVRDTVAANVKRIRKLRDMSGRDFIARLADQGIKLLPSGLTAMEKAERRVTVDELLAIAVVLDTSVVDLILPADGSRFRASDGVAPQELAWVESWLQGHTPLNPGREWGDVERFFEPASDHRKQLHRRDMYPEMQAVRGLEELIRRGIEKRLDPAAEDNTTPGTTAAMMRDRLAEVTTYVNLLAGQLDRIEDGG